MKIIGYHNGFRYIQIENDIFRNDRPEKESQGLRWFSTLPAFNFWKKTNIVCDENGLPA